MHVTDVGNCVAAVAVVKANMMKLHFKLNPIILSIGTSMFSMAAFGQTNCGSFNNAQLSTPIQCNVTNDAVNFEMNESNLDMTGHSTSGSDYGIFIKHLGSGNVSMQFSDTNITTNSTNNSHAVVFEDGIGNTGDAEIIYRGGHIVSTGPDASGLRIETYAAGGSAVITTDNTTIETHADNADGIFIQNRRDDYSKTNLRVYAKNSVLNLMTDASAADIAQDNYGIVVLQAGANANGNVFIENTNTSITIGNQFSAAIKNSAAIRAAIFSKVSDGKINVTNTGDIHVFGNANNGIYTSNDGFGSTWIENHGTVDVSGDSQTFGMGSTGIKVESTNGGDINVILGQDSRVVGGANGIQQSGNGVSLISKQSDNASSQLIINAGEISAESDMAIRVHAASTSSAQTTVTNSGSIWGVVDLSTAHYGAQSNNQVTFINSGNWFIRDRHGDNTVNGETVSKLGQSSPMRQGNSLGRLDNTGLIQVDAALQAARFDDVDFHNSGSFMVADKQTGRTTTELIVNGRYEGHPGSVIGLNTFLDQPQDDASDRLVINGDATGVSKIRIHAVGVPAALTTDNGIQVVQINHAGRNDVQFSLERPVTYGKYEYVLRQAGDQNWYLQNFLHNVTEFPDDTDTNGKRYLLNPNAGSYMGNRYAAASMFEHNILDRRDSVRSQEQLLWIRTRYSDAQFDLFNGRQSTKISGGVVQIGADLLKADRIVAGVFGGYGHANTDNSSRQTGTVASGSVEGYHLGAYASWIPEQRQGPYADVWAYYGWYDNKLSGAAQLHETSYDSTGYAISVEMGYSMDLAAGVIGGTWILEPHAQLIYQNMHTDSFVDSHGTRYADNHGHGWRSRLGARLYGEYSGITEPGVLPFVEVNWLHSNRNDAVRLGADKLSSGIGRNTGEINFGVQGQLTQGLKLWGHMGYERGSHDYQRHSMQIGLGWQW